MITILISRLGGWVAANFCWEGWLTKINVVLSSIPMVTLINWLIITWFCFANDKGYERKVGYLVAWEQINLSREAGWSGRSWYGCCFESGINVFSRALTSQLKLPDFRSSHCKATPGRFSSFKLLPFSYGRIVLNFIWPHSLQHFFTFFHFLIFGFGLWFLV